MRAAHDASVVSVLAVDDHAAFLGAVRAVVGADVRLRGHGEDAVRSPRACVGVGALRPTDPAPS
jgi:hypothetical protein